MEEGGDAALSGVTKSAKTQADHNHASTCSTLLKHQTGEAAQAKSPQSGIQMALEDPAVATLWLGGGFSGPEAGSGAERVI